MELVEIVVVFDSIFVVFVIVRVVVVVVIGVVFTDVVAVVVSVKLDVFPVNFVKADVVISFRFVCLYDMYVVVGIVIIDVMVGIVLGVVFAAIVALVIFKVVGVFLFVKVVVFSIHFVGVRIGSVCSYVLYSVEIKLIDLVVLI